MPSLKETATTLKVSVRRLKRAVERGQLPGTLRTTRGGMRVWDIAVGDAFAWRLAEIRCIPGQALHADPRDLIMALAIDLGHTPSVADLEAARVVSVMSLWFWWGSYAEFCRALGLPATSRLARWRSARAWTEAELLEFVASPEWEPGGRLGPHAKTLRRRFGSLARARDLAKTRGISQVARLSDYRVAKFNRGHHRAQQLLWFSPSLLSSDGEQVIGWALQAQSKPEIEEAKLLLAEVGARLSDALLARLAPSYSTIADRDDLRQQAILATIEAAIANYKPGHLSLAIAANHWVKVATQTTVAAGAVGFARPSTHYVLENRLRAHEYANGTISKVEIELLVHREYPWLHLPNDELAAIIERARHPVRYLGENCHETAHALPHVKSAEEEALDSQRLAELSALVAKLSRAQRECVELRFGLAGCATHTLNEIAEIRHVARGSVRHALQQAMAALRPLLHADIDQQTWTYARARSVKVARRGDRSV